MRAGGRCYYLIREHCRISMWRYEQISRSWIGRQTRYLLDSHHCPNCHEPTISFWRKQFLGPARTIRCSNCSARISVDWRMSLVVVALLVVHFLVTIVIGLESWDRFGLPMAFAAIVLVSLVFCVLLGFIQHRFVKLIVRNA